jgi:pimeloyl-ACP methyl ester carboxylesterase
MARRRAVAVAAPSRFPTELVFRLVRSILILGILLFLVLGVAGVLLAYRVITARNDTEVVTPSTYLLSNYETLNFTDSAGGEHEGWLLLGLKGAPVILLSHGYNSNRSDLLSLGMVLRENHYNVYVFNFYGPRSKVAYSNLGVREAADLLAAIQTVVHQPSVNPHRVGLYGTTLGGYASLVAAQRSRLVRAIVLDTPYDRPEQMFDTQIDSALGGSSSAFRWLAEAEFHLFTWGTKPLPLRDSLWKLEGMPKLFISGRDIPALAAITEELYNMAPQPKRLLVLEHSRAALASGAAKKEYETQILNFFLQNLSLRAD